MEEQETTQETLHQEDHLQRKWHQACREEESYWQQKSRSLWLEEGDKNTSYFHKQVEARKQFKTVNEIRVQDQIISDFEGIKAVATKAFETLYTETQMSLIDSKAYPLSLVPNVIQTCSTTQVFQQRTNTFSNHSHNQIKDQHTDVFTW
jgi:hypothetical protein